MGRFFKTFKGNLVSIVIAAILLPMVLSNLVMGLMFGSQFRDMFKNRLDAGLQSFSLILENQQHDLIRGLGRIASDNTLQMTLQLEIIPQLQKYLTYQRSVLGFSSVVVVDENQKIIAAAGESDRITTFMEFENSTVNLVEFRGNAYFTYSAPIFKNSTLMGYVFGTMSLTDEGFMDLLSEKLANSFIIRVNGTPVASDLDLKQIDTIQSVPIRSDMLSILTGSYQFITLSRTDDIEDSALGYTVLLPLDHLRKISR